MTIRYTIREEDYVQFNYFHFNRAGVQKVVFLALRFGFPLLFMAILLMAGSSSPWIPLAIGALLAAAWILYLPRSFRSTLRRQVHRLVLTNGVEAMTGERTLELTDEGLRETGGAETLLAYGQIERLEQDDRLLYIYCGPMNALLVPLDAFAGAQEQQSFLEALRGRCPQLH